jgi:protein involved in polysaccharide export with SLBB domain
MNGNLVARKISELRNAWRKDWAFARFALALALTASLLPLAVAQQRVKQQEQESDPETTDDPPSPGLRPGPSELERNNMNHVAASATEIRAVLARDSGLMVELKRWVAKEATDNGQIVDDASLRDQAIFDRLTQDVVFRSVATQLLQRYGYLMPAVNPDSPYAKEQDLLIKERVRRLVQVEAQEDSQALTGNGTQRAAANDGGCASKNEADCREAATKQERRTARPSQNEEQGGGTNGDSTPVVRPQPEKLLQARDWQGDVELSGSVRNALGSSFHSGGGRKGFDSLLDGLPMPIGPRPPDLDAMPFVGGGADVNAGSANGATDTREHATRTNVHNSGEGLGRESSPVAMVHRGNPYADIPSLYDLYVQASASEREVKRFGLAIFENGTMNPGAIPMDLPVGPDYVVGPGDGVTINLWGGISQRIVRVVDREGRITLPEAGPLLVSGRTLGEIQVAVQQMMRSQYRDTAADVSLSRLRTIRVYVVGEVQDPGAYDVSSVSTPLNALFAAGGVTQRGSMRAVKHFRGKQLLEEVDTYDLLLRGVSSNQQRLENGDTLVVPPVGSQVNVSGMVRRPGIFELHGEKNLSDVLDLAGGILPAAALRHVEVQRLEAHEKRVMLSLDLSDNADSGDTTKQLSTFAVQDGDTIHIFPIALYNQDAIYLQGHVQRPGRYSFHDGMKLTDLVSSYGDLLPEPAQHYAEIIRLNAPDFRPSVESFDLAAALANPAAAPKLHALDTVRVFSKFDFEQAPSVWVGGEVRSPGRYRTSGQIRLRDAIFLAGGLSTEAAMDSAQLFRTENDGTLKILSVNLGEALAGNPVDNLLLEPHDRILIQQNGLKADPPTVYVKGAVAKPGRYPLTANMHAEDLIRVAGGLKRNADPTNADLTHFGSHDGKQTIVEDIKVPLSANAAADSDASPALRDGDVLTIRQSPGWNNRGASVTLRGEIENPGSYGIRPGERLSSLLERAGGFTAESYPYGAVLMRQEVLDLELKSHDELISRMKAEQMQLRALPENDQDQKNLKLTAIAQTETTLNQLAASAPVGRVVIHIEPNMKEWRHTDADVPMRDGDILLIPKKANYVMVNGQVYNQTAITYQPGRNARWYLGQAGGMTQVADKKAVFVIRADGSVVGGVNNAGWWGSDPLSAVLRPGDSVVVPEKAPKIGTRNWAALIQSAQIATSLALTVATLRP